MGDDGRLLWELLSSKGHSSESIWPALFYTSPQRLQASLRKHKATSICVGLDNTRTVWTGDVRRRRPSPALCHQGSHTVDVVLASLSAPVASVTSHRLPRRLHLPHGAFVNASLKKLIRVPAELCKCFPAFTHARVPFYFGKTGFSFSPFRHEGPAC